MIDITPRATIAHTQNLMGFIWRSVTNTLTPKQRTHRVSYVCRLALREPAALEEHFIQLTLGRVLQYEEHALLVPKVAEQPKDVLVPADCARVEAKVASVFDESMLWCNDGNPTFFQRGFVAVLAYHWSHPHSV